jgi:transcriptional regulator with XRE-family HTH domain
VLRPFSESPGCQAGRSQRFNRILQDQAELARALGVSQQAVFAYEIGDRRISVLVLERLARLFHLNIDQFLGFASELPVRKRRLSSRAMRHAERLQALSKTQQRFVVRIIDVLEGYNKR